MVTTETQDGARLEPLPDHSRIVIVGTGFAGLGMAIRLKQEGIQDFVLLERAHDVGGTWRDNTYPGCACDVPSHLYSFSFAPNPDWSSTFSAQPEIWDYIRSVADEYEVVPHCRFGAELVEAQWDETEGLWRIETSRGTMTADVVVSGMGALSAPSIPKLPGLESFEGRAFHSAQWDHDQELAGSRVAVVGTGASAIQIVPAIQPEVGELQLYQRTPPWIMPRPDRPVTALERWIYRRSPLAQRLMRGGIYWARETFVVGFRNPRLFKYAENIARRFLAKHVPDPELRAKLTPDYRIGCKRILISDDYYPSLTQPNVEVVTTGIREVTPNSIVTEDGSEREVDTIIFGTGFHVSDMPAADHIRGRDGRLMAEVWEGSPEAYLGTNISGFPNLFMLVGPNTGLGHNSIVFMIESQVNYVMDCLRFMEREGVDSVDVRPEAQKSYNRSIDEQMEGTVWNAGGCQSWYLDANGRNSTLWPTFTWPFRTRTRRFDPTHYALRRSAPEREPVAA